MVFPAGHCPNSSSSSLVSTMLHSLTFYLLIDESRVNPIGSGPPPLDKISLIRSRPSKVFLSSSLLPCLESLLLETLCFLGNFLITTADACFISFLSLLFFSSSSFTLFAFVSLLFFVGYSSHSAVPAVSLARVYFFWSIPSSHRVVLQSSTSSSSLDNLLLLVVFRLGRSFFVTGIAASVSWTEENLILLLRG